MTDSYAGSASFQEPTDDVQTLSDPQTSQLEYAQHSPPAHIPPKLRTPDVQQRGDRAVNAVPTTQRRRLRKLADDDEPVVPQLRNAKIEALSVTPHQQQRGTDVQIVETLCFVPDLLWWLLACRRQLCLFRLFARVLELPNKSMSV